VYYFITHFKQKVLKFILTHTFLVLVTVELGHEVYRKLYTLIGGQRAEKFENHCCTITDKYLEVKTKNLHMYLGCVTIIH